MAPRAESGCESFPSAGRFRADSTYRNGASARGRSRLRATGPSIRAPREPERTRWRVATENRDPSRSPSCRHRSRDCRLGGAEIPEAAASPCDGGRAPADVGKPASGRNVPVRLDRRRTRRRRGRGPRPQLDGRAVRRREGRIVAAAFRGKAALRPEFERARKRGRGPARRDLRHRAPARPASLYPLPHAGKRGREAAASPL